MSRQNLRYELACFLKHTHSSFGLKRAYLYKQADVLLTDYARISARRRPRAMNAFFYAKFRTSKQMFLDGCVVSPIQRPANAHATAALADHLRRIDEEELKASFSTALRKPAPSVASVYYDSIFPDDDQSREMRLFYEQYEADVYAHVAEHPDASCPLTAKFVMFNHESLMYCERRLAPDVWRLETLNTKLHVFASSPVTRGVAGISVFNSSFIYAWLSELLDSLHTLLF